MWDGGSLFNECCRSVSSSWELLELRLNVQNDKYKRQSKMTVMCSLRYHSFSTCAKFSEKLTFLTPWYVPVRRNVSFSKNFAYVLNEWPLSKIDILLLLFAYGKMLALLTLQHAQKQQAGSNISKIATRFIIIQMFFFLDIHR